MFHVIESNVYRVEDTPGYTPQSRKNHIILVQLEESRSQTL